MNKISQTVPLQFDTAFSPFKAAEFDAALEFLENQGFTGAELAIAYPAKVNSKQLLNKLESRHLTATSVSTGQIVGLEGLTLSSQDDEIRNKAVKVMREHIDLSAAIGCPPVTIGLIRGKLGAGNKSDLLIKLKASVSSLAEYAFKRSVILQIEPINKAETGILNNVRETLDFIKELGDPENVGLLYDTFHADIEEASSLDAINSAAGKITNVHFADSGRRLPGYGTIDFVSEYTAVQKTGYKGAYALETHSVPSTDFILENCAKSILDIIKNR